MSEQVIDSRAAQTVPPPADAGSPPRDAGASTDASPSPDASVLPDAAASSATPTASSGSSSTPPSTPTRTSSTPATAWSLELDGFVGPSRLGGPQGAVFSPDFSPANEGWNFFRYSLGIGVTHRWNLDPHFRIGLGGRLGYFGFSGDRRAPGRLDGAELSAHVTLGVPIIREIEPELRVMAAGLLATGETTAGNNFSVDSTGGLGLALRAMLGVGIHLDAFTVMPYVSAETAFIPNARGSANAPWIDVVGGILASYTFGAGRVEQAPGPEICSDGTVEETPASIRRRTESLETQIATLRDENRQLRETVHASHPDLNLDELDGLQAVPAMNVPNPLPTDCNELLTLRDALENERDALDRQNGILTGIERVPATAAPHLIRAITRLQEIHFITARPQGAPERVTVTEADIATLNGARDGYLASAAGHNHEPMAAADIENTFRAVFPRTRRADGTTYSPSLDALRQIATALRSPDMRGVRFYIVGNTDSRGADDMNMRLSLRRAEAIRDALIMMGVDPAMITPLGHGENSLVYYYDQTAGGRADPHRITQPEVRMLRTDGIGGAALTDEIRGRQVTNRRVEMFVCREGDTEDPICAQLAREAAPSSGSTPPPTGDAGTPITTRDASAH